MSFPIHGRIRKKYVDELYIIWFERLRVRAPRRGRDSSPSIQFKL